MLRRERKNRGQGERNLSLCNLSTTSPSSTSGCDALLAITPGQTKSIKVITVQEDAIYRSCVIAVTNRSMQKALAEEFADFIKSPAGQAIFLKRSGG
jgi:ABC-type molybdate transport system substrate-binding protein